LAYYVGIRIAITDTIYKNVGHDSLLHNRGCSQSKATNLASNHTSNHNQEQEFWRHHQSCRL